MFKKALKSILGLLSANSHALARFAKIASLMLTGLGLLIKFYKRHKMRKISSFILVVASRKRRKTKFQEIFDVNCESVLEFIYELIGDQTEAQKILDSGVFSEVGYFRVVLRDMNYFKKWLYTIAYNRSINYLTAGNEQILGNSGRPSNLSRRQRKRLIEAKKARAKILVKLYRQHLPNDCPDCQKVLKLVYVKQMSEAEVAKELDMSEKQVKDLRLRAFRSLKNEILKGVTGRAI